MHNDEHKAKLLVALGFQGESSERQAAILQKIERIAERRLAGVLPDLLSDEQARHVRTMHEQNVPQVEIVQWITAHLPQPYDELLYVTMQGVVDDALGKP